MWGVIHSKLLGLAHQKKHILFEHAGHKFGIIEEASVCTSDRNWTQERDVMTALSEVIAPSLSCVNASVSLQDGFMCHSCDPHGIP